MLKQICLSSTQNASLYASPDSLFLRRDSVYSKWLARTTNTQLLAMWVGRCSSARPPNAVWAIFRSSMANQKLILLVRNHKLRHLDQDHPLINIWLILDIYHIIHQGHWKWLITVMYITQYVINMADFCCCSLWYSWKVLPRCNLQSANPLQWSPH